MTRGPLDRDKLTGSHKRRVGMASNTVVLKTFAICVLGLAAGGVGCAHTMSSESTQIREVSWQADVDEYQEVMLSVSQIVDSENGAAVGSREELTLEVRPRPDLQYESVLKSVELQSGTRARSNEFPFKSVEVRASVLDIACGTGELCCELRAAKGCRVVGVELSHRMLRFARVHSRFSDIDYMHGDATNLDNVESGEYDYATILFLVHEIPAEQRLRVLEEALRVAGHVVVVDSHVPLPRNAHAAALHVVESMGGREHHGSFVDYLARGGIMGVVSRLEPPVSVLRSMTFWHGCRDAVVLSRQGVSQATGVAMGQGPLG